MTDQLPVPTSGPDEDQMDIQSPSTVEPAAPDLDYAAIEAAVMETPRGRWFLAEYARRNRSSDTGLVLSAIERLETLVDGRPAASPEMDNVRISLVEMADTITRTKQEVARLNQSSEGQELSDASTALDAVVDETERATNRILNAAERIQEVAWTAIEKGEAKEECETIDAQVFEIYEGCSFQDLTGQRIRKVVQTVEDLETRIQNLVGIWSKAGMMPDMPAASAASDATDTQPSSSDDDLLNGPAMPGEETSQDDIDDLMADLDAAAQEALGNVPIDATHIQPLHMDHELDVIPPEAGDDVGFVSSTSAFLGNPDGLPPATEMVMLDVPITSDRPIDMSMQEDSELFDADDGAVAKAEQHLEAEPDFDAQEQAEVDNPARMMTYYT